MLESAPPPDLPADKIKELFPPTRGPIGDGVFELGLVLGGTVSAGAYTAGVLDYLIEALDAWTAAKERGDPLAPPHDVVISAIGGASGGAINGAILLRAAGYAFPHEAESGSPFYDTWAAVGLSDLLSPEPDAKAPPLASLLNSRAIEATARRTVSFRGQPLGSGSTPSRRSYLADPLRLFMTVTNITGVPYSIAFQRNLPLRHRMFAHADHLRFAVSIDGGVPNPPKGRPDEYGLSFLSEANWDLLGTAAMATSAFPAALRARAVARHLATVAYRAVVVPQDDGSARVETLKPDWQILIGNRQPGSADFVAVDGGATNNEPLDLVRTALAGMLGRNTRNATNADRAVLLIDPFTDPEPLGPQAEPNAMKAVGALLTALLRQARFKPVDLALAADPDVYSRFLIAPHRSLSGQTETFGARAIAAGGLMGFLGFLDAAFIRHDFLLGRHNAYKALTADLTVPDYNRAITRHPWSPQQLALFGERENGVLYLPIIPVMPDLRKIPPAQPRWPRLDTLSSGLRDQVTQRLQAIYEELKSQLPISSVRARGIMAMLIPLIWRLSLRGYLADTVVEIIVNALKNQGLLPEGYVGPAGNAAGSRVDRR